MAVSKDPALAAKQRANLLKGISSDPATRQAQIAKLRPGAHTTHGTQAGARLDQARERHENELLEDYPQLDGRRRAILASRLARIELASAWIERNGLGPAGSRGRGEVFPLVIQLETWSRRAEDLLAIAEAQRGAGNVETLDEYTRRVYGGDDAA